MSRAPIGIAFARLGLCLAASALHAQAPRSLKTVAVPEPPQLATYVKDRTALVALGKAFFWEMQTGSDGRTACATCHFHAGADHRPQNQLSDPNFPFPANFPLSSVNFPLRQLADPNNRNSQVLQDTSIRVGSAGIVSRLLSELTPGRAPESGVETFDRPQFQIAGMQTRGVTARNTPTVINAVFNVRNFWDGRASATFNGFTPDGAPRSALADRGGILEPVAVRLDNASLASQAVGPAMDHTEMSYAGRTWPLLGKKLLSLRPLGLQRVSPTDSVLGNFARADGPGLRDDVSYQGMIRGAFQPAYWQSIELLDANGGILPGRRGEARDASEYTQMEHNFSLFWGLAIWAYESTLVSNDNRLDQFLDGDRTALSTQEQDGLAQFTGNGRCTTCHGGAELTAASFSAQNGTFGNGFAGRAFRFTGVRPATDDAGSGAGSFKTSGLREIEFTGPYFHNGGQSTLEQVVDFYARGGDFANGNNIRTFNATNAQRSSLVAFMKALTDDRVRYERAPFDHPELCVPTGHTREAASAEYPNAAAEHWAQVPAVGNAGNATPLQTFDEMLKGLGSDGSRAHALIDTCPF